MTSEEKAEALRFTLSSRGWLDVVRPAMETVVNTATNQLITGKRNTGEEEISDDHLKGRIVAMRWLLDQERAAENLVKQLEAIQELRQRTEPASEGGSPYT